jgi:hypothetical protein
VEERGCEPPPAVSGELGVTPGMPIVCVDVFCGVRGAGFQSIFMVRAELHETLAIGLDLAFWETFLLVSGTIGAAM